MWYPAHKITILCGHYGSGKTNLAVNLAAALAEKGEKTVLVDLDIVNPYFRAADNRAELEAAGVRCIIPPFANSNVDIPTLPPDIQSVFIGEEKVILDVGGDKDGAAALGVFRASILRCGYDMLGVCNMYRPLTQNAADTIENLSEIERQCGLAFTALVNNSNLGEETTADDVKASFAYADELAARAALPLLFTAAVDKVAPALADLPHEIFPIRDRTRKLC